MTLELRYVVFRKETTFVYSARVKEEKISSVVTEDGSLLPLPVARYPGYALKMTWDVPVEKAMGILKVSVCWHDIVFRNEWGFTENTFIY